MGLLTGLLRGMWRFVRRRRYYFLVGGVLAVVTAVLLLFAAGVQDFWPNLWLNLGADLIGTIVVLFGIAPVIERGERIREDVLDKFPHRKFIGECRGARQQVRILELWLDLLEGGYRLPFTDALRDALEREVAVRILLLDPDSAAARQRADDLGHTNVVVSIMDNLQRLHEFRHGLPDWQRRYFDIRIYSALPPVQMYGVDDHLIVSFFPVNMTSWNAAQYQTNPNAQLGLFVCAKFDELWQAENTRTLDQFRAVTVRVGADGAAREHEVRYVRHGERIFVSGREIAAHHLGTGIAGLPARLIEENAQGDRMITGPYALVQVEPVDPGGIHRLFEYKYGQDHEVVLELVRPKED